MQKFYGFIATASLVALGACSGGAGGASEASSYVPAMQALSRPAASSPCNVPELWYFRGSCKTATAKSAGFLVRLPGYKGITLHVGFGKNSAAAGVTFAVGNGTSDKDITGRAAGAVFPVYGSVGCVDSHGNAVACSGKGLLYAVLRNGSSTQVNFTQIPAFTILTNGSFGGSTCQSAMLRTSNGRYVWQRVPVSATPSHGTLALPASGPIAFNFGPGGNAIFAFFCY